MTTTCHKHNLSWNDEHRECALCVNENLRVSIKSTGEQLEMWRKLAYERHGDVLTLLATERDAFGKRETELMAQLAVANAAVEGNARLAESFQSKLDKIKRAECLCPACGADWELNVPMHCRTEIVNERNDLQSKLHSAHELLCRIAKWDNLDTAADGAFWRSEIDKLMDGQSVPDTKCPACGITPAEYYTAQQVKQTEEDCDCTDTGHLHPIGTGPACRNSCELCGGIEAHKSGCQFEESEGEDE